MQSSGMFDPVVDVVSTKEAAAILGIARRSLMSRVEVGTVKPMGKLPGRTGAFFFDRSYIEHIASVERNEAEVIA